MSYLDPDEFRRLQQAAEPAVAEAGSVILHKGSPARSLLFVEQGTVEVCDESMGDTVVLATIRAGGVVGEVGFVDGRPRTHDVRAGANCRLRRLTREGLLRLVHADPQLFAKLAVALAELVARRFRETLAQLEPVRAFAASLDEPLSAELTPRARREDSQGFDELDEPLPSQALELIRQVARGSATGAAGA